MAYTFTIENSSKQALAIVEYLKTLSFVKFTETKTKEKAPSKAKAKSGLAKPVPELLEEDKNGVPLKYKEEIIALSKKTKKAAAKRFYEKVTEKAAL
ncbi:hypothetical protein [Capnocytophaga sp. oral taxon 338]|uniref:hypothetical protein n=1 Tax=Capnocytophaga sp. oral taxon 338 TaxID=710239 RepID=UPI000202F4A7|nr:hypothetical protein [Capnocytophaga sp. oral taxon 338]EGD34744.1 hypothetical protein HMPREF9071_0666 [Capnocytophaga sp. oral taxon 338 str. F0234]